MRPTLEQLKNMQAVVLYRRWEGGQFPFEFMKSCNHCMTQHIWGCPDGEHMDVSVQVQKLSEGFYAKRDSAYQGNVLKTHIEELYALRMFYDKFYSPEEQDAITEEDEKETVSL